MAGTHFTGKVAAVWARRLLTIPVTIAVSHFNMQESKLISKYNRQKYSIYLRNFIAHYQ